MIYSIKGVAFLVLTLGMAYVVLALASKEKGLMKNLGYLIAVAAIVAFVIGALMPLCKAGYIPMCTMK